jgi:hypothetical protein
VKSLKDVVDAYYRGEIIDIEAMQSLTVTAADLTDEEVVEGVKALLQTEKKIWSQRTPEERKLPKDQRPPRQVIGLTNWGTLLAEHIDPYPADGDDVEWGKTFEIFGGTMARDGEDAWAAGREERRQRFRRGVIALRRAFAKVL